MGEGGFIKVTETKATTKEENERIVTSRRARRRRERERDRETDRQTDRDRSNNKDREKKRHIWKVKIAWY